MTNAIEIKNLTISFNGNSSLVDGFSLSLEAGDKVTLAGASGCGKSSVLKTLHGFLKPTSGEIRIEGELLNESTVWELRKRMAYVPQEPPLPGETVKECLYTAFTYSANRHLQGNLKKLPEFYQRFRLKSDISNQLISDLSGGEKQRIAIISALLLERRILLLDEASSALDPETSAHISAYLSDCEELTVLSVNHHIDSFNIGGRIVRMEQTGVKQ